LDSVVHHQGNRLDSDFHQEKDLDYEFRNI